MVKIKNWLVSESGFQVFEGSALALCGIFAAFIAGGAVLAIVGTEYTRIEYDMVGNRVETDASIERFR